MPDNPTPAPSRGHAHAPLSRSSRRLIQLSLVTPRPCHIGSCICLTHPERRALHRVSKIVRQWKRQVRRRVRERARIEAQARAKARQG
jgi:hypothetical protein